MKEFTTAISEEGVEWELDEEGNPVLDEEGERVRKIDWTTFKHDGFECRFRKPKMTQFSLMLSAGVGGEIGEEMGSIIRLLLTLADDDTRRYFQRRLWDMDDEFDVSGAGGMLDILQWLMEEWSARPTKQPSDYKPSQRATGRSSTARTRAGASTSSRSRRAASSQ